MEPPFKTTDLRADCWDYCAWVFRGAKSTRLGKVEAGQSKTYIHTYITNSKWDGQR